MEQEEVKRIQRIIYEQLCKNEYLVKEYTKLGILARIKTYIKDIKIEMDENGILNGWSNINNSEIVICSEEKNIRIEDLIKNKEKFATLIHESVHKILKNSTGTGLLIIADIDEEKSIFRNFKEIGRGINEGYTNWITKQCGVKIESYQVLTSINEQIACCIGIKKMTNLSKGGFKRLARYLNMNDDECIAFTRKLDEIYYLEGLYKEIEKIEKYLKIQIENLQKENLSSEDKILEERSYKEATMQSCFNLIFTRKIKDKIKELKDSKENTKQLETELYKLILEKTRREYINPSEKSLSILVEDVERNIIDYLVIGKLDLPKNEKELKNVRKLMKEMDKSLSIYSSNSMKLEELKKRLRKNKKRTIRKENIAKSLNKKTLNFKNSIRYNISNKKENKNEEKIHIKTKQKKELSYSNNKQDIER